MTKNFAMGVYPTMLTPFDQDGAVDYESLGRLTDWYIENGANGLFAVCQSSEMFFLSLRERVEIAAFVKKRAAGHCPVIASGHVSYGLQDQAEEIERMAGAGVDAVVLVSNRLAAEDEPDSVWRARLEQLLEAVPQDISLGFYECPYPSKRLMSEEMLRYCAGTGRFYFLKDTCCDAQLIERRLAVIKGSPLKLYNANSATLLPSLRSGAGGYSGVMANFQPKLYRWLWDNFNAQPQKAEDISALLTASSLIETQLYPAIAKYHLARQGIIKTDRCRVCNASGITPNMKATLAQLQHLTGLADRML